MARPVRRRVSVLVTAVVAGGLVAGCGEAAPASPFPPRPAEIDVTALDLCALLTPEQQRELGVGPGDPGTVALASGPSRSCSWGNNDEVVTYTVQTVEKPAVTAVGSAGSRLENVAGYGAVRITDHVRSAPICELYIDTSDVRTLRVQVQSLGPADDGAARPIEEVCRRTSAVALEVVANIRTGAR